MRQPTLPSFCVFLRAVCCLLLLQQGVVAKRQAGIYTAYLADDHAEDVGGGQQHLSVASSKVAMQKEGATAGGGEQSRRPLPANRPADNASNGSNGSAMLLAESSFLSEASRGKRNVLEQAAHVPPLVLALSSLGQELGSVNGLTAPDPPRPAASSSLLEAKSEENHGNFESMHVELPATQTGVTNVRRGEVCPFTKGLGKVGCTWGCECGLFESCFVFSSPLLREEHDVALPNQQSSHNQTAMTQGFVKTASGQARFKLGHCSLSGGGLAAASAVVVLVLVTTVALLRAYLQHRENMQQLEDELNKLADNNYGDLCSTEGGPPPSDVKPRVSAEAIMDNGAS